MKLLREGARHKEGRTELIPVSIPHIMADHKKIIISSYGVRDSQTYSESTYDFTIKLFFQELKQILKKLDESLGKYPGVIESIMGDNTKTLFRLLMLASGTLNNYSLKEEKK